MPRLTSFVKMGLNGHLRCCNIYYNSYLAILNYERLLNFVDVTAKGVAYSGINIEQSKIALKQNTEIILISRRNFELTHKPVVHIMPLIDSSKSIKNPFKNGFLVINDGKLPATEVYIFYLYSLQVEKRFPALLNMGENSLLNGIKLYHKTRIVVFSDKIIVNIGDSVSKAEIFFCLLKK